MVASRHASIGCASELSADESELLVQVRRYGHDPVPWRAVDGSTIGPVNPWFLLVAKGVGWPMNYAGLHFLAALLLGAITAVSYATLRLVLPFRAAAGIGAAGAVALAGASTVNYMYFATELVPALALAVTGFAVIWASQRRRAARPMLALAAVFAGLAPWAKLQSAPIAAALGGVVLWLGWRAGETTTPSRRRWALPGLLLICAVAPTVVILTMVVVGGVYPDFFASYVIANLGYAGDFRFVDAGRRFVHLLRDSQLNGLFAGVALLGLVGIISRRHEREAAGKEASSLLRLLACVYLGSAVFSCVRPPHEFEHYHLFLIGPLIVALGALSGEVTPFHAGADRETRLSRWRGPLAGVGVLAAAIGFSVSHYEAGASLRDHLAMLQRDAENRLPAIVAREIRRLAPHGRTMVVWGWMPTLHLQTGLESATRQTIGHFLIDPGPSREFIRAQFLRDVRAAKPDVIVDAVATGCFTWFWQLESSGLESFPALAAYVKENYTLALNVMPDSAGTPLRVFVRRPAGSPP